ncbi:hypothetical protein [Streptomyces sp. CC210A]|uniref:hypothetical protein n=1 Tax=Streptomyces sp. CC210A TaxID=2898184 RepID=UPI001F48F85D|nr:hypothetical protein [Streptomyces sp. CC210A]
MPETMSARRSFRPRVVVLLALCLAMVGGIGGWLVFGKQSGEGCNGLLGNESLLKTVAAAGTDRPSTCAELGDAITKATTGGEPGRHTVAQAQAMKSVLYALAPAEGHRVELDPALRPVLASALADYGADIHARLHSLDPAYTTKAGAGIPPWQDAQGVHMAVDYIHLLNVLTAVAEDPEAYAAIRMAVTRTAERDLASVPARAVGDAAETPAMRGARALGALNGVAATVGERLGDDTSRTWRTRVAEALLASSADAPTGDGHLTSTWLRDLRATAPEARADFVDAQPVEMIRIWATERGAGEAALQRLRFSAENSSTAAANEAERALGT